MSQHTDSTSAHRRAGYDVEITRRPVYWTGLLLIATALLAFAAMWALMRGMQRYDAAHAARPSALQDEIDRQRAQGPPEPRLQPNPNFDMLTLRTEEDALLSSYGWADRTTGKVRIPIDRAMDLIAAQGLGAQSAAPTAPPAEVHP